MKIIYSGHPAELLPKERAKIEGKLAKFGKIIEKRGEKEVHIILSQERHLHHVEMTMQVYGNAMVGVGSDGELSSAMGSAIEKLEKQILKLRTGRLAPRSLARRLRRRPSRKPKRTRKKPPRPRLPL